MLLTVLRTQMRAHAHTEPHTQNTLARTQMKASNNIHGLTYISSSF